MHAFNIDALLTDQVVLLASPSAAAQTSSLETGLKQAERLLATMPIDEVSHPARLPPGSYLPLRRFRRKFRKRFARGIASLLRRR